MIRFIFIVFISNVAIGFSQIQEQSPSVPEKKLPNILLISLDDMNDWIGPMGGHPQALTPNLDSFSESGMTFRARPPWEPGFRSTS